MKKIQKTEHSFIISFLLIALCAVLPSCGADEKGLAAPAADLNGNWSVEEAVHSECGEGSEYTNNYTITITQTGNSISAGIGSNTIKGTISGNIVKWGGTFPEDDGSTTINFTGTVSPDGDEITGTAPWTWTNDEGTYSCTGTTDVTATRISSDGDPADVNGTWYGDWTVPGLMSGGFTAEITASGSQLSGTIDIPTIGFNDVALKGSISGNTITFGDVNDEITFTGAVFEDSASGTFVYPDMGVSGTWEAEKEFSPLDPPAPPSAEEASLNNVWEIIEIYDSFEDITIHLPAMAMGGGTVREFMQITGDSVLQLYVLYSGIPEPNLSLNGEWYCSDNAIYFYIEGSQMIDSYDEAMTYYIEGSSLSLYLEDGSHFYLELSSPSMITGAIDDCDMFEE